MYLAMPRETEIWRVFHVGYAQDEKTWNWRNVRLLIESPYERVGPGQVKHYVMTQKGVEEVKHGDYLLIGPDPERRVLVLTEREYRAQFYHDIEFSAATEDNWRTLRKRDREKRAGKKGCARAVYTRHGRSARRRAIEYARAVALGKLLPSSQGNLFGLPTVAAAEIFEEGPRWEEDEVPHLDCIDKPKGLRPLSGKEPKGHNQLKYSERFKAARGDAGSSS